MKAFSKIVQNFLRKARSPGLRIALPLLLLTGYKCPGCRTLRAAHALLHMRFAEA